MEYQTQLHGIEPLKNPSEVFLTASLGHYLSLLIAICGCNLYDSLQKKVHQYFEAKKETFYSTLSNFPISLGLLLLVVRDKLYMFLNTSDAYFSKHLISMMSP